MYASNGGGILGGFGHENSKKASIHFVELAAHFVDKMELVTEFPLSAADNVRFYLITPIGIYASDEYTADDLASGNDVIKQLRLANSQ